MPADQRPDETAPEEDKLLQRWWVEQGKPRERAARPVPAETLAGASFYKIAAGYSQDVARRRLTDLNLKLLQEANPPPDGWAHLEMTPDHFPAKKVEQIKRIVELPPGGRAVAIDSGVSLRLILTGDPPGERLLELRFGEETSFDAWVRGEWVYEAIYEHMGTALKAAPGFIAAYLTAPRDAADGEVP